jgi:hypothetical protein
LHGCFVICELALHSEYAVLVCSRERRCCLVVVLQGRQRLMLQGLKAVGAQPQVNLTRLRCYGRNDAYCMRVGHTKNQQQKPSVRSLPDLQLMHGMFLKDL